MPLSFPPITLEEFAEFCRRNPDLQAERTAGGELIIMPPAEAFGDSRNAEITAELVIWNRTLRTPGIVFGPSAGFTFPTTAVRSPDAAWISFARWRDLTSEKQSGFAHTCPEFVVELMSPSDKLKTAKDKMEEYLANGAQLGWLINRKTQTVYVYRTGQVVQTLHNPQELTGDPELPGFVLPMHLVF